MTRTVKPWTASELTRLLAMRAAGKSNAEIGIALGRTANAVYGKLTYHLALLGRRRAVDNKPWPKLDKRPLAEIYGGRTYTDYRIRS